MGMPWGILSSASTRQAVPRFSCFRYVREVPAKHFSLSAPTPLEACSSQQAFTTLRTKFNSAQMIMLVQTMMMMTTKWIVRNGLRFSKPCGSQLSPSRSQIQALTFLFLLPNTKQRAWHFARTAHRSAHKCHRYEID